MHHRLAAVGATITFITACLAVSAAALLVALSANASAPARLTCNAPAAPGTLERAA